MLNTEQTAYYESLKIFIDRLKKDLKKPNMNVVIGRISDFGSKHPTRDVQPGWSVVRSAQERFARETPYTELVDTDECNGKGHGLHYTKEGYEKMGRDMAKAALKLITKRGKK